VGNHGVISATETNAFQVSVEKFREAAADWTYAEYRHFRDNPYAEAGIRWSLFSDSPAT